MQITGKKYVNRIEEFEQAGALARVAGLKERAAQKSLTALYNAVNNANTSLFFAYLFYPRVSQLAMPRLVIRKLDEQLKLYFGIYAAFNGADSMQTAQMGLAVNYLHEVIDNYFNNSTALSITSLRNNSIDWLNIKWGPLANPMFFPTNQNPHLPAEFRARLSKHIHNELFYISEQSITDYYACLFNDFIKGRDITTTIEKAYSDKSGKTLEVYLNGILDSTAERAWVLSTGFELVNLSASASTTMPDCNASYPFDKILMTVDGKSALQLKGSAAAIPGLRTGAKIIVGYFSNSAPDGFVEVQASIYRIDQSQNTVIIDKLLTYPLPQGGMLGLGGFKFDCTAQPEDLTNADLILWLDVPGYQQPLFSSSRVTRYDSPRVVFTRIVMYNSLEIVRNMPKQENTGEAARILEITGQVNINGRYGYIVPRSKYQTQAGAIMIAAIHATPQFAGIPNFVKTAKRDNNGTYIGTRLNNALVKYDPDGVLPGYSTLQTGQYVSTAGITGKKIGAVEQVLAVVATVISILVSLSGLIAGIVASFKATDLALGTPTPQQDWRTDNCKWADNTYTTLACLQDDGTYELFDTNYNHIGPAGDDFTPPGGIIEAGFGYVAAGLLVLLALGSGTGKPQKRKK